MLTILEEAKAKLEALEAKGIAEVREIIEHLEEAIGIRRGEALTVTGTADDCAVGDATQPPA